MPGRSRRLGWLAVSTTIVAAPTVVWYLLAPGPLENAHIRGDRHAGLSQLVQSIREAGVTLVRGEFLPSVVQIAVGLALLALPVVRGPAHEPGPRTGRALAAAGERPRVGEGPRAVAVVPPRLHRDGAGAALGHRPRGDRPLLAPVLDRGGRGARAVPHRVGRARSAGRSTRARRGDRRRGAPRGLQHRGDLRHRPVERPGRGHPRRGALPGLAGPRRASVAATSTSSTRTTCSSWSSSCTRGMRSCRSRACRVIPTTCRRWSTRSSVPRWPAGAARGGDRGPLPGRALRRGPPAPARGRHGGARSARGPRDPPRRIATTSPLATPVTGTYASATPLERGAFLGSIITAPSAAHAERGRRTASGLDDDRVPADQGG